MVMHAASYTLYLVSLLVYFFTFVILLPAGDIKIKEFTTCIIIKEFFNFLSLIALCYVFWDIH